MQPQRKQFNQFRQRRLNTRLIAREQLILRNNLEKRFYKRLDTLFRKFLNTNLYLYKEFGQYEPQIAQARLDEEFIPLIFNHYKRLFQVVYKMNEDNNSENFKNMVFGRSIDFEKLVADYFQTRVLFLSGISQKLSIKIANLIEQGRIDNLTLPAIAANVSKTFLPISRSRAAMIARTETHNAASFANNAYHVNVADDLGLSMKKKWVSTSDGRTRPAHSAANGQVVDMNEDFIVGGVPMGYAGDPKGGAANVVNCRCVIIYADERDIE